MVRTVGGNARAICSIRSANKVVLYYMTWSFVPEGTSSMWRAKPADVAACGSGSIQGPAETSIVLCNLCGILAATSV